MLLLYLTISFVFFLISCFLFRKAAGALSLTKPNLISYIFYYNIILQTLIGAILAVCYLDNHYVISRVSDESRLYGWLAVMYLLMALPSGMLLSKYIFVGSGNMKLLLESYAYGRIKTDGVSGNALKYSIWVFTVVSIGACIYTFSKIGYFPFLKAAFSSAGELSVTRIHVSREFSGNIYIRNFFALAIMPVLSYVWAFYFLSSRRKGDLLLALVSLFFALSILYYDFSKGPILWHIVGFLFVYFYARGKLPLKFIVCMAIILVLAIVGFYLYSGNSLYTIFGKYYSGPIGRIILTQVSGFFVMLDVFPNQHDFIGLSSMSKFLSEILNADYIERAARIAMVHFNPSGVADGVAGVMSTIFIGEAWANFGIWGILLSPVWVGFLLHALYVFFLTIPKNPLFLGLFVSFSLGGITGGVNHYLYNPLLIMSAVWVAAILLLALYFRTLSNYKNI